MTKLRFHQLTFSEKVLVLVRLIPPGFVTTYGDLARAAGGGALAAQSVTSILSKAYRRGAVDIPFHRIVYAGGRIWLDEAYKEERLRLYAQEGLELTDKNKIINFSLKRFDFRLVPWVAVNQKVDETREAKWL